MESYVLVTSIKHTYDGISYFRANSCSRRITHITSVVERFNRKCTLFFRQDPRTLAVLTKAASDGY